MNNKSTRQRIPLTPEDNRIIGKYNPEADQVHVICNSTSAAFAVALPPSGSVEKPEFVFYNVTKSGNGNSVTISGNIDEVSSTTYVIPPGGVVRIVDGLNGFYYKDTSGVPIPINYLLFNTEPFDVPTDTPGVVYYDDQDSTLNVVTPYAAFQLGQELGVLVSNKSGADIDNGKPVYIDGALGNRPTIELLTNTSCEICHRRLGITTTIVPDNGTGIATTNGLVRDVDTSAYTEGDLLYVGSTPGTYTTTLPAVGSTRITAAMVVRVHPTQGVLLVLMRKEPYMFGDPDGGDYSVFEDDGTLKFVGDATVHEDLNFAVVRSGGPVATRPDDVTINNVYHKEFTSLNNQSCGDGKEIPHSALLGQRVYAHAHIFLKSGESAGTTGVTFRIYYEARYDGSVLTGSKDLSATSAELTANPYEFRINAPTTFTLPNEKGVQLSLSLHRISGDAGDIVVSTYGLHYEIDTVGSRTADTK